MHPLLRGFLDLLYPPRCEGCGRLRREPIRPDCLGAIARLQPPMCEVCGEPFDPRAACYEGPLVQVIWRYKYHCQMVLAEPLARLMIAALYDSAAALDSETIDVVCAVPLHPSRLPRVQTPPTGHPRAAAHLLGPRRDQFP